ncbi:MAG: hypothetical protein COT74_08265 [Bdellovibrionales bacterium CG10_big_fil_rev_8_21_14_0_10_45_34]|nr:MAG: hypothetical protein COT74_08265 [Bdellovibrionales bacterium CG10_big_fil_rev_8_21_14_0_10_45_34]
MRMYLICVLVTTLSPLISYSQEVLPIAPERGDGWDNMAPVFFASSTEKEPSLHDNEKKAEAVAGGDEKPSSAIKNPRQALKQDSKSRALSSVKNKKNTKKSSSKKPSKLQKKYVKSKRLDKKKESPRARKPVSKKGRSK